MQTILNSNSNMAILNSNMGGTIPNNNLWEIIRNNNNHMVGVILNNSHSGEVIQASSTRAMWSLHPMLIVTVGTTRRAAPTWPTPGGGQEPRRRARMKGFQDFLTRFATSISHIFMDK